MQKFSALALVSMAKFYEDMATFTELGNIFQFPVMIVMWNV